MSYSFVVIDLENKCNINDFATFVQKNYVDYEIIYCSSKSVNIKNVVNFEFKDMNSEKVVNTILCKTTKDNIVLIRKLVNFEDISKLTENLKNNNDVVYLYKKQKGIKKLLNNIFNKTIRFLFSQEVLNIKFNAMAFGSIISKVLRTLDCPSKATRTNNWTGVNTKLIEGGEEYKFPYNKTKCALYTLIPLAITILLAIIRLTVTIPSFLASLVIILTGIIGFIFFFIFAHNWIYRAIVGENVTEKAEIIKGE